MAFTPKVWKDHPDRTTPISAGALIDMETRLSGYTDQLVPVTGFAVDLPALVAPFNPRQATQLATVQVSNNVLTARVVVPKTGTLRDLSVYIGTSSGNISGAVYSTDSTRARLYTTGAIASPGTGWRTLGDPQIAVTVGTQLDFAVSADNTTVTFAAIQNAVSAINTLPTNFAIATGGASPKLAASASTSHPAPATITEGSLTVTAYSLLIIARIA